MRQIALIGIGAGLASALLLVATATGGLGIRLLVYLLAPLPLVLAGLGAGSMAAALGAVVSTSVLLAVVGDKVALLHAVAHGIPAALLCHLALLSRERPTSDQYSPTNKPLLEWYPVGRIVAIAAVCAGLHGFLSTVVFGIDIEQQRAMLRQLMGALAQHLPRRDGKVLSEDELSALVELGIYTLPGAAAFSWLLSMLLNLYIGTRITAVSGRLIRPLPDVPSMIFPVGFSLGLAMALPLAFTGGTLGFIGSAFAGAFFCAHLLMGLAIVHDLSRGSTFRPGILAVLYVALVFLNGWASVALAIFAALAPILPLSRGKAPAAGGPD
ncbi:MAG: hypothetical protein ACKVP7_10405 [Hyphomicrobiaceae bacterium]